MIYYKITPELENYQYKDGLNVFDGHFNEDVNAQGGFYFTTAEYMHEYYIFGDNVRVIELPENNPEFKFVKIKNYYRSNMIIMKEKYNFNVIEDVIEILKINNNVKDLVNYYSLKNNLNMLMYLKNTHEKFDYDCFAIRYAAHGGNVKILEWFYHNHFIIDKWAVNFAITNNHINVLEFFETIGYAFKEDICEFFIAENYNNGMLKIETLEWLIMYGYIDGDKYFGTLSLIACHKGDMRMFIIFKNMNFNFSKISTTNLINIACEHEHVHLLDWFNHNGFEKKVKNISKNINVKVLEWLQNNFNVVQNYENIIHIATRKCDIEILDWFISKGYEFKNIVKNVINLIIDVKVLEWYRQNFSLKFHYNVKNKYHENVLIWLKNNGIEYGEDDIFL